MSYFFVGIFAHICQTLILDIAVVYVFVFVFAIKTKMTDCQDHMPTANIWFVWSMSHSLGTVSLDKPQNLPYLRIRERTRRILEILVFQGDSS